MPIATQQYDDSDQEIVLVGDDDAGSNHTQKIDLMVIESDDDDEESPGMNPGTSASYRSRPLRQCRGRLPSCSSSYRHRATGGADEQMTAMLRCDRELGVLIRRAAQV